MKFEFNLVTFILTFSLLLTSPITPDIIPVEQQSGTSEEVCRLQIQDYTETDIQEGRL